MILVVEPTYADAEHAPCNAAMLHSIALAHPNEKIVLAATPDHQRYLMEVIDAGVPAFERQDIAVLAPGGVTFSRFQAQYRTIDGAIRGNETSTVILLSCGPETFFACRLLVLRHPGLRIFIVVHGNLKEVVGWRSRDPRRRLFDFRSGLAIANHRRIRLIVLEDYIREAAANRCVKNRFLVWPHPISDRERPSPVAWTPGPTLNITFVGSASLAKGFGEFSALRRRVAEYPYRFQLAGVIYDDRISEDDMVGIERPKTRLTRPAFLDMVRRADYCFVSLKDEYNFTASGSLLDCISQCKPIIAVGTPILAEFERKYGRFGFLCPDIDSAVELMSDPVRLRDPAAYAKFQDSLRAMRRDRLPDAVGRIIDRDLAAEQPPTPPP
jgi:hypothetical protein